MTTLFNLFCPLIISLSITKSLYLMMALIIFSLLVGVSLGTTLIRGTIVSLLGATFSASGTLKGLLISGMLTLAFANLLSLVCYNYPLTTTLGFNLSLALSLWMSSILMLLLKRLNGATVLPANSPWYLVPFLAIVEVISIGVRPITLCFRLLANMTAGHVLLTLITKMGMGLWLFGSLFGLLELMVSMVQAFVFLMLTSVYLEEAFSH